MADTHGRAPAWFGWAADGAPALAFLVGYLSTRDFQFATWCVIGASVLAFLGAADRRAPHPTACRP